MATPFPATDCDCAVSNKSPQSSHPLFFGMLNNSQRTSAVKIVRKVKITVNRTSSISTKRRESERYTTEMQITFQVISDSGLYHFLSMRCLEDDFQPNLRNVVREATFASCPMVGNFLKFLASYKCNKSVGVVYLGGWGGGGGGFFSHITTLISMEFFYN